VYRNRENAPDAMFIPDGGSAGIAAAKLCSQAAMGGNEQTSTCGTAEDERLSTG
jgi:hypothetical protein